MVCSLFIEKLFNETNGDKWYVDENDSGYNLHIIKVSTTAMTLINPVFIRLEDRQCDAIIWLDTRTVIPREQLTVNEIASLLLIFSI